MRLGVGLKSLLSALAALLLLNGCFVDGVEKLTQETRDQVRETKEGSQIAAALETCLNPHVSESARVAACKPVLLRLPEDRIADYLGLPLRIVKQDSHRRVYRGAELELPNVLYVGEKDQRSFELELAPTAPELHNVLRLSAAQAVSDIASKALLPGISGDEMQTLRAYGQRLIFVSTAIFGAVDIGDLNSLLAVLTADLENETLGLSRFQSLAAERIASLAKRVPESERRNSVDQLMTLCRNLSLSEGELATVASLAELRLGIRP